MTTAAHPKSRKPERLLMRFEKGALVPADGYTAKRIVERGFRVGDQVLTTFKKPVNPGFFRKAHVLGQVIADNIDEFSGMDAHTVLKRIQVEANVECDEIPVVLEILGQRIKVMHRTPRSLGWESMDGAEFMATIRRISNYVAETYWPDLDGAAIERMAELMPEAA